jgi:serine/threonine-protein kinase
MRVVDFGEEPDGLLYIAMEYVDGKTLAHIIDEDSPLPVARIVDIASQALAALAVAHDLGVIHRDLKPENIMILEGDDDEGHTHDIVKVCDFGVAKLLEGSSRGPSVTGHGVVVGTPEYMSPEQARGDVLDARSDIYAMGVLLFHLMTGKVPFDSSTAFGTALMHVNDEPTRPRLLNPRVDTRLEKICLKAMKKNPDERHASARELRAELRALVAPSASAASDAPFSSPSLFAQVAPRPRRSGLVLSAAVLAASLGAGVYMLKRPAAPAPAHEAPVAAVTPAVPAPVRAVVPTTEAPAPTPVAVAAPAPAAEEKPAVARVHSAPKVNARRPKGHAVGPQENPQLPPPNAASKTKPTTTTGPKAAAPVSHDPADMPLPEFPIPAADPPGTTPPTKAEPPSQGAPALPAL